MTEIAGAGRSPRLDLAVLVKGGERISDQLATAAQKSAEALFAVRAVADGGSPRTSAGLAAPALTPPTPRGAQQIDGPGQLTLLLGELLALLGDVSLSQLANRLATWQAMMAAQVAMGQQLSGELQVALAEMAAALDSYDQAVGDLTVLKAALAAAKTKLAQAGARLEGLSPTDPGYDQAVAEYQQALGEADQAEQRVSQGEARATAANNIAMGKATRVETMLTELQGLANSSPRAQQETEDHLNNLGRLTMLMAMFVQLIGKNGEESLKTDLALFKTLQEGRQKEMEQRSIDYQNEVRKAEELNRTMGCIGKVLGALLTVVSVVAAVFTGGASLALAAVGLALMVADEVGKAVSGVSFMQEALNPLMEKVVKPLMDLIGKFIGNMLKEFGVEKAKAEMIGAITGAIAAVLIIVAAVVLGAKGVASKLGGTISNMMGDTLKKVVPELLKEMAKNGSKLMAQGMQRLGNALGMSSADAARQMVSRGLNLALIGIETTNAGTQAGGSVAQGVMLKDAAEAMADFTLARGAMAQIEQWLQQTVEMYARDQKLAEQMMLSLSNVLQQSDEASRFVLRHSRA